VTNRYAFFKQINSIIICGVISLGLAILYMFLVQWFARLMNELSVILGLLFLCIMALFIIFYPNGHVALRIVSSIVILLLLAIVAIGAFKSRPCFTMHGIFLTQATNFLRENMVILVFVPIFLAAFTLFLLIIVWELKSLWSSASLVFSEEEVYYQFKSGSTTFSTFVVLFQFMWGLSFLK
jgi:hypothetical protein